MRLLFFSFSFSRSHASHRCQFKFLMANFKRMFSEKMFVENSFLIFHFIYFISLCGNIGSYHVNDDEFLRHIFPELPHFPL